MTAKIEVISEDDDRDRVECGAWLHPFMGREDELDGMKRRDYNEFQWGNAITCHSSQGSQFDDVLLFDESKAFGASASRWIYTGVTRAAKSLTVVV